ncbi:MAG: tetratricopeptide repeat protein [Pirellulales bacterium]|nr:tetratricopeptide repeat protein [Pirellulales bacterium]
MSQPKRESQPALDAASAAPSSPLERARNTWRSVVAWCTASRLRLLVVALLLLNSPFVTYLVVLSRRPPAPSPTFDMALAALDEGNYRQARNLAEWLREARHLKSEEAGGPAFVLGVINYQEACDLYGRGDKDFFALAARYLERSRDLGFPAGREATGHRLLGESLYRSGQIVESRPHLEAALASNPDRAKELHRMLVEAYLDERGPDPQVALQHVSAYLAAPQLTDDERAAVMLAQVRIQLQLGHVDACRVALESIDQQARERGEATVLRARLEIDAARRLAADPAGAQDEPALARIREHHQAALALLKTVPASNSLDNKASGQASYLMGYCLAALGEDRAALEQFTETRTLYHSQPEGLAAAIDEADLLRKLGREESAAAYARVLLLAGDPAEFRSPWVSLEELRRRVLAAYDALLAAGKYAAALELASQLEPLFPRDRAVALLAETNALWSRALLDEAAALPRSQAESLERDARARARKAGENYVVLAQLRFVSRDYPNDLWNAADNFYRGRDYLHAIEFYKLYLTHEARQRRAFALVGLAESYLAVDEVDLALTTCRECLEAYPRDAANFRARLVASRALVELGKDDEAKKLLLENLQGDDLTPASIEWRDSLFELARILHLEQKYAEALPRLEEAVARYGDQPQSLELRYLLADSAMQLSAEVRAKAETTSVATARLALKRQSHDHLHRAVAEYDRVQHEITRRQATGAISPLDAAMLRNCYFARGAALTELERYDEAIDVYNAATNRYQNSPAVMEAYIGTANCYRQLGQLDEARGIVSQAKVVLSRVRQDATVPFEEVTNYSSDQWELLLDWLLDFYGKTT